MRHVYPALLLALCFLLQACDTAAPSLPLDSDAQVAPSADLKGLEGGLEEPGGDGGIVGPSQVGHYCSYGYSASSQVAWAGSGVVHVVSQRFARSVTVNSNGPLRTTGFIKAGSESKALSKVSGSNCLELVVTPSGFESGGATVFGYEYAIDAVRAPYYWSGAGAPSDPSDRLEVYEWEVEGGGIHSYGPDQYSVRVVAPIFVHDPNRRPTVVAVTNVGEVRVGGGPRELF